MSSPFSQSSISPPSFCCWACFLTRSSQGQQTTCQQFRALSGPLRWQVITNVKIAKVLQIWEFLCAITTGVRSPKRQQYVWGRWATAQIRQVSLTSLQPCKPKVSPIHLYGKYLPCHILFTYSRDHQCICQYKCSYIRPTSCITTIFKMDWLRFHLCVGQPDITQWPTGCCKYN